MSDNGTKSLTGGERRFLLLLALPTLALSLGVTAVSSLLPVVLQNASGSAAGGLLLALEGLFAVSMPALVGAASDGTHSRLGPRLPFVAVGIPLMAVAIAVMPAIGAVALAVPALVVFYLGYFTVFAPHFALYVDLVPDRMRGRAQGFVNTLREVGLGLALVGGPVLLAVGTWVPFAVTATLLMAIGVVFVARLGVREDVRNAEPPAKRASMRARLREDWQTIRENRPIRLFIVADALWELALNALRAYVVLFFTVGIGRSAATTSLVLLGVAIVALAVSPVIGWLADRYDQLRLLRIATTVYACGLVVPGLVQSPWVVVLIPPVAASAVFVMTLPFALLTGYLGDSPQEAAMGGRASGIYGLARGVGLMLGPLCGGLAILATQDVLTESHGYGAVFLVAAAAIGLSKLVLRRMPPVGEASGAGDGEAG